MSALPLPVSEGVAISSAMVAKLVTPTRPEIVVASVARFESRPRVWETPPPTAAAKLLGNAVATGEPSPSLTVSLSADGVAVISAANEALDLSDPLVRLEFDPIPTIAPVTTSATLADVRVATRLTIAVA